MSSRLFRAVVGIGISLGTASAACLGSVDTGAATTGNDTTPGNQATSSPPLGAPPGDPGHESHDGGTTHPPEKDAAVDAPRDAILDAFCDASWPTTKGNPHGPTCGDVSPCADAGPAPYCQRVVSAGPTCDPNPPNEVAWCVDKQWKCSNAAIPREQCKCWQGSPCSSGSSSGSSGP